MALLTVDNLGVEYPLAARKALDGITFQMDRGESLLIVGPTGSGKSTLVLALCGLIPRAVEARRAGAVLADGVDVAELGPGQACLQVGVVFQDPESQFCMLTVEDEIAFGLENASVPRREMRRRIDESLAAVGMASHRRTRLDRLSGGTKQRLALACLLAVRPPVLVFDEPTANLDPQATDEFFALLTRLVLERQHAVVIVEHKLEAPAHVADRVLVLADGRPRGLGPPREVFAREGSALRLAGVWQPFASELATRLEADHGHRLVPHPLTVSELLAAVQHDPVRARVVEGAVQATRRTGETGVGPTAPGGGSRHLERQEPPALSLRGVHFSYRTPGAPVPALRDLTWHLPAGRFAALVGPNGAGKSTLAYLALGLLAPDAGAVDLFGQPVERLPRSRTARMAALVFQNPEHQFVTDTVFDEIASSVAACCEVPEERRMQRVWELLEEFELADLARANPFSLSQGEKRRLSVAAMLAADQALLVLDEPTFGQDYANAYRLMDRIAARHRRGTTVLMLTHDMRLVWEYAQEVAVLVGGRLVYAGGVDRLFSSPDVLRAARLRPPPAVDLLRGLAVVREVSGA